MWLLIAINNYIREQGSLGLIPDFSLNSVYYENKNPLDNIIQNLPDN